MTRPTSVQTLLFVAAVLFASATDADAIELRPGFIISPQNDNNTGAVYAIDPATGNREILSRYPDVGTGPRMRSPFSITLLPDHDFLVTDAFTSEGLFRIDHETGNRTFISGIGMGVQGDPTSVGSGPIDNPNTVLLSPDNDNEVFVVNGGGRNNFSGFITKIDLTTGNRTLVSGLGVGSGFNFGYLGRGAFGPDGRIFVPNGPAIMAVDTNTGARSYFSGFVFGSGPAFTQPYDIVALPDGDLIVADANFNTLPFRSSLFRVNGLTGDRTLIAQHFMTNQDFDYQALSVDREGRVLSSAASRKIFRIDPVDGSQVLLSGGGRGTGPPILNWGDMVVVIPEPTTSTLGVLLAFALGASRRRQA